MSPNSQNKSKNSTVKKVKKLLLQKVIRNSTTAFVTILRYTDDEALAEACRALIHLCQLSKKNLKYAVDLLIKSDVTPKLMQQLDSENVNKIEQHLQALAYFVDSSKSQTQHFIDAGLLPRLANLMKSANRDIVCLAAWNVRNIATQTNGETMTLVRAGFVPLLVDVVDTGSVDARNHAMFALGCIAADAEDFNAVRALSEALPAMCRMLTCKDMDLVLTLHNIYATLMSATNYHAEETIAVELIDCGGLEFIKNLQNHERDDIRGKARAVTNCILDCLPRAQVSRIVDHF